jgi:hypothetical protein
LLENWVTVTERLNSTEATFIEEKVAVTDVTKVLQSEMDDPDNPTEFRRVFRTIVAEVMENAIKEFEDQIPNVTTSFREKLLDGGSIVGGFLTN